MADKGVMECWSAGVLVLVRELGDGWPFFAISRHKNIFFTLINLD